MIYVDPPRGVKRSVSARHGKVIGSMLGCGTMVLVPDALCSALMLDTRPRCSAQTAS